MPQMALEEISAFEGWSRLLKMVRGEKGGYAGYAGMKLLLAIGAGIYIWHCCVHCATGSADSGWRTGRDYCPHRACRGGLTWNVFTITLAVVAGCHILAGVFLLRGADFGAGHRVLSRVFDLLFCRAVSEAGEFDSSASARRLQQCQSHGLR